MIPVPIQAYPKEAEKLADERDFSFFYAIYMRKLIEIISHGYYSNLIIY